MDVKELFSYLNWPGDRPSSVGEENDYHEAQSTAGDGRKPAEKKKDEEKKVEATVEVAKEVEATAGVAKENDLQLLFELYP